LVGFQHAKVAARRFGVDVPLYDPVVLEIENVIVAQFGKPTARSSEPLVVLSELAVDALDRRPHGHGNGPGSSASPLMTFRAEIIARADERQSLQAGVEQLAAPVGIVIDKITCSWSRGPPAACQRMCSLTGPSHATKGWVPV